MNSPSQAASKNESIVGLIFFIETGKVPLSVTLPATYPLGHEDPKILLRRPRSLTTSTEEEGAAETEVRARREVRRRVESIFC